MNGNTICNITLACLMVMMIPWVNVNIHCCELEIKECKKELKLREKEIKELKQYVQKMDSCKIHVHYHY